MRYYLPWRHQFAYYRVKNNRNCGIMSSSRAESAHRSIKRYLKNRLSDLVQLYQAIRMQAVDAQTEYKQRLAQQRSSVAAKYTRNGLVRDLTLRVSTKALELIWRQVRLDHAAWLKNPQGNPYSECSAAFTKQYGLPCKHLVWHLL